VSDFLHRNPSGAHRLRTLIHGPEPVLAPGAFDAMSARLIEHAGFPAVYMTGYGTSASRLGRPDVGLLTQTEMVDQARRIVQAVDVPVIADADTGYGNALNVIRTVQEYEQAGVAAIHLEDQLAPKRCGHMEGKQVIAAEEMVEKIQAAVEARRAPEFVIIARTDARAVEGLEGGIRRARMYREAGADAIFYEAPQSEKEVEQIARELQGTPLLFNWLEGGGKTPGIPLPRLTALGFKIVIFPLGTLFAATKAIRALLEHIRQHGTPLGAEPTMVSFAEFVQLAGLPEIQQLEQNFCGLSQPIPSR
jgi:carboxyvinyl-carboxyphosphonate phosphorylmutase